MRRRSTHLVVDANILIEALVCAEGRRLVAHRALDLFATEAVWADLRDELSRGAGTVPLSSGDGATVIVGGRRWLAGGSPVLGAR